MYRNSIFATTHSAQSSALLNRFEQLAETDKIDVILIHVLKKLINRKSKLTLHDIDDSLLLDSSWSVRISAQSNESVNCST